MVNGYHPGNIEKVEKEVRNDDEELVEEDGSGCDGKQIRIQAFA